MKARYDIQLMVKVAKKYHLDGFTQEQIAKELKISRSSISMILFEAKEMGIIQINVKDPKGNVVELADELISIYGLKGCLVIKTAIEEPRLITKVVASQGADYAQEILRSQTTVGIAWGMTCYEFMNSFTNRNKLYDINVVPLIGGTSRIASEYQLNEMVRMFAEKVQGIPSFIYAPAIAESSDDKELYMQSISMKGIVEKWNHMDAAIVSAGYAPDNGFFLDSKHMGIYEADESRAIGDICARRFNLKGKFLNNEHSKLIMGIDEDNLRRIDHVICIAGGKQKVLSMIGALRTGIIKYLVTDENTARDIISLIKPSSPEANGHFSGGNPGCATVQSSAVL